MSHNGNRKYVFEACFLPGLKNFRKFYFAAAMRGFCAFAGVFGGRGCPLLGVSIFYTGKRKTEMMNAEGAKVAPGTQRKGEVKGLTQRAQGAAEDAVGKHTGTGVR